MNDFTRHSAERIQLLATQFKVVVLTGARQVGKSTLLKNIFPHLEFVTLDLPQDAALAEMAPAEFLSRHTRPLVVDEVQYAPKLFRHLKSIVDASKQKGQFILTGSQRFVLMKEVSESLAGRAAIVDLHTLSCLELGQTLTAHLKANGLSSVLARGFYPALWENENISPQEFYRSYVATWLERDLRQLLNVGSLRDFERFLRACAARSAQLLNKSDLARDVGISVSTAAQWISVLQTGGLITLLEPYFSNRTKRMVKAPKLYFNDVGLMCFLLGLDARALQTFGQFGSIWETFAFGELIRWKDTFKPEATLHFYRDKEGVESDFILDVGGKVTIFDAKSNELAKLSDMKNLEKTAEKLSAPKSKMALITPTRQSYPLDVTQRSVVSGFQLHNYCEQL
jgi:uncharacterized protein